MTHQRDDLFVARASAGTLHPNFVALRDSPFHGAARALMNDLYARMGDPNGGFVGGFQGEAFHARLFELACFGYLESAGFEISRAFDRPDFLGSKGETTVAFEAATVNPSGGGAIDLGIARIELLPAHELAEKVQHEFPRRMLAVLRKKLAKKYHEMPHCTGRPLVVLAGPFFEPGSVYYTDEALVAALYGHDGRPEPFFTTAGAEMISAVAYCNQFTVPRFFRLGTGGGLHPGLPGIRQGTAYRDRPGDEFEITEYQYELGHPAAPTETWSQGVTLFHNPRAAHQLPRGFVPCTSEFHVADEGLRREVAQFHPVTSFMLIAVGEVPPSAASVHAREIS